MQKVLFDIECDGLLPKLTRIHSLVVKDLDTGHTISCTDDSPNYRPLRDGLEVLSSAEAVYGHNILGYDLLAIRKVYPRWDYEGVEYDSQVLASARFPHIKESDVSLYEQNILPGELIGSQALEAWGIRLGILKSQYEGTFEQWNPEMQKYCEQDVEVNEALIEYLRKSDVPKDVIVTEHELRKYLVQQEINGWPFDLEAANLFHEQLKDKQDKIKDGLRSIFKPWYRPKREVTPKRSRVMKKNRPAPETYVEDCPYTRIELLEFNPASRNHIADRLQKLYGWEPKQFTEKTQRPKINEAILEGLDYPGVEELKEYLTLNKRIAQLATGQEAWIKHATLNPKTGLMHIHHRVKQNFAITARASHASPNLAQVPKVGNPYGEECRELFYVPEGWVQVGADVSGLELRTLAHYMWQWDGGEYAKLVLSEKPNDVHTNNAKILGVSRDRAKIFIYALIYGAGDAKLGLIIQPGAPDWKRRKIGEQARSKFMAELPALGKLTEQVRSVFNNRGYLKLIDGRRAYPRAEHSALNTLIQGTGAIVCKRWIVEANRRLMAKFGTPPGGGWDYPWAALGWIHDEVQEAARPEATKPMKAIFKKSISVVRKHYSFKLPLDCDVEFGQNWAETH